MLEVIYKLIKILNLIYKYKKSISKEYNQLI